MRFTGLVFTVLIYTSAAAQENSPYSRYGLGDLVPNHNILNRAMGGIAAAYADNQTVNFTNPASYSYLQNTIFDVGAEFDNKTLKSISPAEKFSSSYSLFPYLQLGLPIAMKKANKKDIFLGLNIGLKPVSRINYKIEKNERIEGGDSLTTLYEGSGGLNQVYAGAGLQVKGFSIGFNAGYMFGNKDYSTRLAFVNDTVSYYQSNSSNKTTFGAPFINGGVQYEIKRRAKGTNEVLSVIRFGLYGNLQQNIKAKEDVTRETVVYDASGNDYRVDSVYEKKDTKGTIIYPATLGFGITYQKRQWLAGADFEFSNWKNYRYYKETDHVQNSWKIRAGAQYVPAKSNTSIKKYFNFVQYRAGFYYGTDYVKVNNDLPEYGFTFGAGFPLKLRRAFYETQSSLLNTAFEIGARGDKKSNLRENVFRVCIGLSLSDFWFRRAKYD